MKKVILFLLLPLFGFSQFNFEEIIVPDDFSLGAVMQSPTGEYFVQSVNDRDHVYTSINGSDWIQESLPESVNLDDMDFYTDGTPVIRPNYGEHMIRRAGIWLPFQVSPVEADNCGVSVVRNDTLFVYHNRKFGYSLNYGVTFTIDFEVNEFLSEYNSKLWRYDSYYVLKNGSDNIIIFDNQGQELSNHSISFFTDKVISSDCGEIIFLDYNTYISFRTEGLTVEEGPIEDIFTNYSAIGGIQSQGNNYYYQQDSIIYRSSGCNFDWQPLTSHPELSSDRDFWVTPQNNIFFYTYSDDYFWEWKNATNEWRQVEINISFANIVGVSESINNQQFSLTPNNLFYKKSNELDWNDVSSLGESSYYSAAYSPEGTLYVLRDSVLEYSNNDGASFTNIEVPDQWFNIEQYKLHIPGEGVIFMQGTTQAFYSSNNGGEWFIFNGILESKLDVKLVDNSLLFVNVDIATGVVKIDLSTNDSSIEELFPFFGFDLSLNATVQDDGTIYIYSMQDEGSDGPGLYSFQFGEVPIFLGAYPELASFELRSLPNGDLLAVGQDRFYVLDGIDLIEYSYSGIPESITGYKEFYLSENYHLFVVTGRNQIFRSAQRLYNPLFVTGSILNDVNQDCELDSTDTALNFWQVKIENDDYFKISTIRPNLKYKFFVPEGSYTVSTQPIDTNWDLCEMSYEVTVEETNSTIQQDFNAFGVAECAELTLDFSTPRLRRCFDNYYRVRVRNSGPQASENISLFVSLDPFFTFSSASIPIAGFNGQILEFDLGTLALNEEIYFTIYFTLSCEAELGAEHCMEGNIVAGNVCSNVESTYVECQENIGSFDPNDKRTFNAAGKEISIVDKDEYIYYHIRFQNTGTDTAFTVRVVDTLSPILDLNTLEMLSASHNYSYEVNDGPMLEVLFDDILLPDSTTNETASNGYFKFRIKPLASYDYGTSILNQADIYFDFNDPIITNQVITTIEETVNVTSLSDTGSFSIFPNPSYKILNIKMEDDNANQFRTLEFYNQLGQKVLDSNITSNTATVDVAKLWSGLYYVVLKKNSVILGTKRFLKM